MSLLVAHFPPSVIRQVSGHNGRGRRRNRWCRREAVFGPKAGRLRNHCLPVRQLQLDTAVACAAPRRCAVLQRLELAIACGHQPLRRHAAADQVLHHRDGARASTAPSWTGTAGWRSAGCRCGRRPAAPSRSPWGLGAASSTMAAASWSMAARPSGVMVAWPEGNSTSDWNTKRSPTTRMSLRSLQKLAQAAEEVGAVALQLLHLAGEHDIEAGAEVVDARLALLVLASRRLQRLVQGGDLPAQRQKLLVEQIDLGDRLVGDVPSCLSRSLVRPAMRASFFAARRRRCPTGGRSRSCSVASDACSAASSSSSDLPLPFSRLSRLVSSAICRVSCCSAVSLPLASWLAKILRHHEDRHQERDDEQQRRQHVDVARPELARSSPPRADATARPWASPRRFCACWRQAP